MADIVATWLAVGIVWAGVRWADAGPTFVWLAIVITSPITAMTVGIVRRRLADRAAALNEAKTSL